jgi:hypothetical protein
MLVNHTRAFLDVIRVEVDRSISNTKMCQDSKN